MNKTIYLTLQNGIKQLSTMILFIVLARCLTISDFGKYQQILLFVSIFGIIFSMGLPTAISYYHGQSNNFNQKAKMYKRFFYTQLFLMFLGSILFFGGNSYLSKVFDNSYFHSYSIAIVAIMFTNTSFELFKNLCMVTNSLRKFTTITSVLQLTSVITNVFIAIVIREVYIILIVTALFNIVIFALLVKINLKYFLINSNKFFISKIESKYVLSMGSVALVAVANGYMDQIMVSLMLDVDSYSTLRIGAFQIPFISIIAGSLLTAMVPIVSRYFKEKEFDMIIDVWRLSIEKATVLLIPIIIFCLIFADNIIVDFFGLKYEDSIVVFQVYMLQWLRTVVIFSGVMGSIGLEKELFKNTVFITLANIPLNYILISYFGVIGAAISTTFLSYFGVLFLIKKINGVLIKNFFSYFPLRIYFVSMFLSFAIGLALKAACYSVLDNTFILIATSIIFYVVLLLLQMQIFYQDISYKRFRKLI